MPHQDFAAGVLDRKTWPARRRLPASAVRDGERARFMREQVDVPVHGPNVGLLRAGSRESGKLRFDRFAAVAQLERRVGRARAGYEVPR